MIRFRLWCALVAFLACVAATASVPAAAAGGTGAIGGTVTDSLTGLPIPGVTVNLGGTSVTTTASAADGHFLFAGLGAGRYTVCFDAAHASTLAAPAGYSDQCYNKQPVGQPTSITVASGQSVVAINAALAPASRVQGTVTDSGGQGLLAVRVTISRKHVMQDTVFTGFNGTYTSDRLTPGISTVCFHDGFTGAPTTYQDQCWNAVVSYGTPTPLRLLAGHVATANAVLSSSGPVLDPGAFISLPPVRLLDTRTGNGARAAPVAAGSTVALAVAGRGGVPARGVSAVVVNVTVTGPTGGGTVTVYAAGHGIPVASNLNYVTGQTVPNLVVAPLGWHGRISLHVAGRGTVHLIADVAGYFLAGQVRAAGAFRSLEPVRLLDTRVGNGVASGPVRAGSTVTVPVSGRGGVPLHGVSAVVVNVTVTQPTSTGTVTVFAAGGAVPVASNVNYVRGQTVPNLVVAPVNADGEIALHVAGSGTVALIADVSGYFRDGAPVAAGAFGALPPVRLLDTRIGNGAAPMPVVGGSTVSLAVAGRGGVPGGGVAAVMINVTVTSATSPGFVTVYADGGVVPVASNLNFAAGQTVPNLVVAPVGADGNIALHVNATGTVALVADVSGYFLDITQLGP